MKRLVFWILLTAILVQRGFSTPNITEAPDDDDDEWEGEEEEDSSEADDDGRIYKNPRNSPSTECPRDEEQATLLGQKCLRKCSSDEDCKSKKKKCLCDGACGMSCIKPDRECPELANPSRGTVTLSGRHFASRATYTCPHGYHVVGLQSRLCQADGQWAGTEPACKQNIYCLTPPLIEHARHSALPEQATFDLDATVQYHCHTGYVTNGFPRAKCLAIDGQASWYGPDIQCEPRPCGQPPDPANGWHSGECYTFGCRVMYHCGENYELVGKTERFCQADGSWIPKELPTCVLVSSVQCPQPENPKNGKAIYTTFTYNSVVSYECRYGYTLIGESSRRCGADRKWSGALPVCKEINCGQPDVLYNGWLENIEIGTGLGASIIFRCHPEMLLVGNGSTVCQIDGRWRYPVPQCLAPCIVPSISQGQVIPVEPEVDVNSTTTLAPPVITGVGKVKHGTSLEVICDEHYEFPISSLSPPTCNNGTWSIIPRCIPARCKNMPKPPKNGMVLAPKTEHGMKARFKCKDGYNLTGPAGQEVHDPGEYVLTCSFGNWTGELPQCQEVYCSFPGYIPNGKVLLVGNMGLYDYRPYVKKIVNNKQIMYDCDKGYVLEEGPPGATCVGGKWRPTELPSCLPGQHPRLRWNRRRRSTKMQYPRSKFSRENSRRLKHWMDRVFDTSRNIDVSKRPKRRIAAAFIQKFPFDPRLSKYEMKRFIRQVEEKKLKRHANPAINFLRRERRNPADIEKAYLKYYERIKQKYRNYVKNLLGYDRIRNISSQPILDEELAGPTQKIQVQDGRWYNSYNDPDFVTRNRVTHKTRIANNDLISTGDTLNVSNEEDSFPSTVLETNYNSQMISIPNINQHSNYGQPRREPSDTIYSNNSYYESSHDDRSQNYFNHESLRNLIKTHGSSSSSSNSPTLVHVSTASHTSPKNLTYLIAQLKSQIVRRRRKRNLSTRDSEVSLSTSDTDSNSSAETNLADQEHSEERKGRPPRDPCEELLNIDSVANVTLLRQGKGPTRNSPGTILNIVCYPGYKLNIKNQNSTVRCVRGIWKPQKPNCVPAPCSCPSTEHGKYYEVSSASMLASGGKSNLRLLIPYEEVPNEQIITFECEQGFNQQGPQQLRCVQGNWAVAAFPECVPSPCVLPSIPNVIYEGGYRSGLTIAHGSSVSVHCDSPANSLPIQMVCNQGSMSPPTIHCESGSRRSREEYLGEAEFVSGDISLNSLLNVATATATLSNAGGNGSNSAGSIINNPVGIVGATGVIVNSGLGTQYTNDGRACGSPKKMDGTLVYKNEIAGEDDEGYDSGTEITFNCIASVAGERNTWKIICEDGNWIGRSLSCANGTCLFRNNEPNVVSFYNDLEIREEVVEFPPGATIISRCVDIGKYAMVGSGVRACIHSEWTGQKPACFGLNQENDYAMEKAPTVLFRHQNGPIAQSNDGKLIVYPGATVHMECLWMKRFGNPKWMVSHDYRTYPEGWVTEEGRDPQLEYRLSVFHAVEDDSGVFTCQTPARHEHSVVVVVKAINCPDIPIRRGLQLSTNDTKMSTRIQLSCANGNSLIGASELVCMPSGNWSAPLPVCESVECGDIPLLMNDTSPRVAVLSREVGGRAAFSCPSGYGLRGPSESICLPSGEWATPFPTCVEVQCDNPGAPQNGYAQGSAPYRAGDVVQFNCNPEYMMQGQPIIACQDNGRWSGGLPKCVQACSYPGTAISGRMSSVKFYYAIGESITFTCDAGLEIRGAKMLKCLRNGKWSNAIPTCLNSDHQSSRGSG